MYKNLIYNCFFEFSKNLQNNKIKNIYLEAKIISLFVCLLFGFYGISDFVDYLMPNPYVFK